MSAGNSSTGSLFRSLGADDSFFESRARAASKEAEQRWPLFKAVAPSMAQETPQLSTQQRESSWSEPAATKVPKEPRLSRPGLGQKLASGLRELGQKTKREIAALPAAVPPVAARVHSAPPSLSETLLPTRALAPSSPPETPAAKTRTTAIPRATAPTPAQDLPIWGEKGAAARKKSVPTPPQTGSAPEEPAQAKKKLFAGLATPRKQETAEGSTETGLQGVFARLSAEKASKEGLSGKKRSPLFGRMGK